MLRIRDAPRDRPYAQGICGRDTDARESAPRAAGSPRRKEVKEERRGLLSQVLCTPLSHLTSVTQRLFPQFHRRTKKASPRLGADRAVTGQGGHPPPRPQTPPPVGLELSCPRPGLPLPTPPWPRIACVSKAAGTDG